ncbi:MAG: peptidylprolyl isomerase [Flavobacteriaceae bacterium]|nr:peptidylprolyl isomerase [Flavobacteriaceae bacterium]
MNKTLTIALIMFINILIAQDKQAIAKIETPLGDIYFKMYDQTPNHKKEFITLANTGYYDEFCFNRVINNFVIQGGCPDTEQYFKDSPYIISPEFAEGITHKYGAVGIGRDDNPDKNSNMCQLYIVNNKQGLPRLDGDYMIFGEVIKGMDIVEAISSVETNKSDEPNNRISMKVSIELMTKKDIAGL